MVVARKKNIPRYKTNCLKSLMYLHIKNLFIDYITTGAIQHSEVVILEISNKVLICLYLEFLCALKNFTFNVDVEFTSGTENF